MTRRVTPLGQEVSVLIESTARCLRTRFVLFALEELLRNACDPTTWEKTSRNVLAHLERHTWPLKSSASAYVAIGYKP